MASTPPGSISSTCSWIVREPMRIVSTRCGASSFRRSSAFWSRAATSTREAPEASASSAAPTPRVPDAPRMRMLCPGRSAALRIADQAVPR
ncbi:hypothetical protein D9M71_677530 [compost metagenome]